MMDQVQDEQQSFQDLKNKWAQHSAKQEQVVASPPPIPPKPSSVVLQRALSEESDLKSENGSPKKVSLLTQQFEKVDVSTPGKFSSNISAAAPEKPVKSSTIATTTTTIRKPPPPPTSHSINIASLSPPHLEADIKHKEESSDEDSDSEDDDFEKRNGIMTNGNGEADNSLIEQVQKAHLKYTKQSDRYIGAPGVRNPIEDQPPSPQPPILSLSPSTSKTLKKPPPPPPPSKKYHTAIRAPPPPPNTLQPPVINIPISEPKEEIQVIVEAINVSSPPLLPPRPGPGMPMLPPRPSQSTLARAHTIATSTPPLLAKSPSPDVPLDEDKTNLKRFASVTPKRAMSRSELFMTSTTYPDFTKATRNPPSSLSYDKQPIATSHKIACLAASRNILITGSGLLRTWDIKRGTLLNTIVLDTAQSNNSNTADINEKIKAVLIAPSRYPEDEGRYVWVARQDTILNVIDLQHPEKLVTKRPEVHASPISFLLRYGNSEIWSIDQRGTMYVWNTHTVDYLRKQEVTPHATTAAIYGSKLLMSTKRSLYSHTISTQTNPDVPPLEVRIPNDMGNVTKILTIPVHPDRLFASHDDGKISIWDATKIERIQVMTVSMYGICTMACVGEYYVWAGYNTGMIYVYDTRPEKWVVLKMWKAHSGAVTQLYVDDSGLILGTQGLQVISSDSNGSVGVWDGLMIEDWKDNHLHKRASEYCTYDDAKVMICSWNIDASKPEKISEEDRRGIREWLGTMEDPDIIVVGIQEIVDLESKKQTARSLFFKKKIDPSESEEVLTHRYKLWHDFLIKVVAENYGSYTYTVIKTDQLVGLFSCVFVRTNDLNRVLNIESTSVKTGLKVMNKSIHGNKGGIAIRFVYDHSSLCFVNCHLAAGQSHVQQRNADAEGILQSASFSRCEYEDVFIHGGDGSMVLDHEFCFLSGDLNYRINMDRTEVLTHLKSPDKQSAWKKLQEQDQLLRQKINNPLFKLLTFEEAPIQFDPTYKYDPGTDYYDRSEKKRVPAWCDRVLYKGKINHLFYRRFEPRCSDHRPIAAGFSFQTKITDAEKREKLREKVDEEWNACLDRFVKDKKARYIADYEECSLNDAFKLLEESKWNVALAAQKLFAK